jgi:WD40 repeat protein
MRISVENSAFDRQAGAVAKPTQSSALRFVRRVTDRLRMLATIPARLRSPVANWIDGLWGYDVFIAHRRVDGASYAGGLSEALEARLIKAFLDVRVYKPGDALARETIRNARKSSVFLFVGSPDSVVTREPDWVKREVDAYLDSHVDPKVVVVDFGGVVASAVAQQGHALARLGDVFRFDARRTDLDLPPAAGVLTAIEDQLAGRRVQRRRSRWFAGAAVAFATIAAIAAVLAVLATEATRVANVRTAAALAQRAQQLLEQPVTNESAALIPALAMSAWRLSRQSGEWNSLAWNAMQRLVWAGKTIVVHRRSTVDTVVFAPDSSKLVGIDFDGSAHVVTVADGNDAEIDLQGHLAVTAVASSNLIALGGRSANLAEGSDGPVTGWVGLLDLATNQLKSLIDTPKPVLRMALLDSARLAVVTLDAVLIVSLPAGTTTSVATLPDPPLVMAVSPDNQWMIAGGKGGVAWLVSLTSQRPPKELRLRDVDVASVAFSPDPNAVEPAIAIGADDGAFLFTLHVDDPNPLSKPIVLVENSGGIRQVVFGHGGDFLATAGYDGSARAFTAGDSFALSARTQEWRIEHDAATNAVALSPDGRLLATGSDDGTARLVVLMRLATTLPQLAVIAHSPNRFVPGAVQGHRVTLGIGEVKHIAFSPDGRTLATTSDDDLRLFPIIDGFGEETKIASAGGPSAVAFADGGRVAVGDDIGVMQLVNAASGKAVARLLLEAPITALGMAADGRFVASANGANVEITEIRDDGPPISSFSRDHSPGASSVAVSPDGLWIAGGGLDGGAELVKRQASSEWQLHPTALPRPTGESEGQHEWVMSVTFSGDSRELATGSMLVNDAGDTGLIRVLRLADGQLTRIETPDVVYGVALSADGSIASAVGSRFATAYNVATSSPIVSLTAANLNARMALSPNGRYLAAGADDSAVHIAGLADGRERLPLQYNNAITNLVFSADSALLAIGSSDATASLYDVDGQFERLRVTHQGGITAVALNRDASLFASAGDDGWVRVWRTDPNVLVAALCRQAGRNLSPAEWRRLMGATPWQATCAEWPTPID